MEIEGDGIGTLDAFDERRQFGRPNGQRPEGAVDMKADFLLPAQIAYRFQIVDRAGINGTCRADHQKRLQSVPAILRNRLPQGSKIQAERPIHRNFPQSVAAQPGYFHRLCDAHMRSGRGVGPQLFAAFEKAGLTDLASQSAGAGDQNCKQICQ